MVTADEGDDVEGIPDKEEASWQFVLGKLIICLAYDDIAFSGRGAYYQSIGCGSETWCGKLLYL